MIKIVALLKRRPGMSLEEFRDYYENVHLPIGALRFKGNAISHHRRYLTPIPGPDGVGHEADYDVIMEMWFEDRAQLEAAMQVMQEPELAERIAGDVPNFLDRADNPMFFVEEHVTDLR
ncbi:EthD domain-containing protein [Croceicoccus sediminis]|uniref:EthD domain-containing protein n=1 Tax=Croceicoccus sediminis TaxID=2571150 RepID=UPI0011840536|nr:EthD domain-containing protein [Croceicoccus sediminis]